MRASERNGRGHHAAGLTGILCCHSGVWKVLGGIALLAPRFPRLKEWAYAGAFFDLTGAAASHVVCGSATWRVVMTVVLAALALISWALRPPSRTLGILFPPAPFRRRRKHETETKRPFLSAVDSKRLMGCRWYEAGHRVLVALGWYDEPRRRNVTAWLDKNGWRSDSKRTGVVCERWRIACSDRWERRRTRSKKRGCA